MLPSFRDLLHKILDASLGKQVFLVVFFILIIIVLILLFTSGLTGSKSLDSIKDYVPNFVIRWLTDSGVTDERLRHKEKTMFGYFNTLNEKGTTVCMEETLSLKFYENDRIEADGEANVHKKDGGQIKRRWKYVGFKHGNDISLSFVAKESLGGSAGVLYLLPKGAENVGYWLGEDLPLGHRVQCPYLLTDSKKQTDKTCKEKWPEVFKPACKVLEPSNLN